MVLWCCIGSERGFISFSKGFVEGATGVISPVFCCCPVGVFGLKVTNDSIKFPSGCAAAFPSFV